jgi:succinate dehydrogenase / fumarate reductase cytochrome b subunit
MNRLVAIWRSTIGKKIAMAGSGILLVLFLLSHMISNVTVLIDPKHLDDYAAFLRSFGPLLWVARLGLLALVGIHVVAAWQLTQMARGARTAAYDRREAQVATYAARTMRWGGVLVVVFIVYHILHYTTGTFHPDFREGEVGRNLIVGMQSVPVALFYAATMLTIGMHLWHGTWSVFQTLGVSHPAWDRTRRGLAVVLAVVIAGGFLLIPLSALLGVLQWPPR